MVIQKWSQVSFNGNTSRKTRLIWSGLCMSSPSSLHWLATQHFYERYKCKQRESFLSQPEHSIWVLIINTVGLNLALHWRQDSCPGTTLIFMVFSCWAIWRVITCSPLTLQRYFINSAQHLLSLLSKTLPNTSSQYSTWPSLSPSHLKVLLSTNSFLPHLFQRHANS